MNLKTCILGKNLSGKVGNYIAQKRKKGTILRAYNNSISTLSTANQIMNQFKFKNTTRAYLYMEKFFDYMLPIFKDRSEIKNYFFSMYLKSAEDWDNIFYEDCWIALFVVDPIINPSFQITKVIPREDTTNFRGTWIYFHIEYFLTTAPIYLIVNRIRDDDMKVENLKIELEMGEIQIGRKYLSAAHTFNYNVSCYLLHEEKKMVSNVWK